MTTASRDHLESVPSPRCSIVDVSLCERKTFPAARASASSARIHRRGAGSRHSAPPWPTAWPPTVPTSASCASPTRHQRPAARVVGELVNGSAASVAASAELLNQSDVAIIQHEYGIYGGADGDEVVDIIDALRVPSIVVAHTVLKDPTPHQRSVLEEVAARADHRRRDVRGRQPAAVRRASTSTATRSPRSRTARRSRRRAAAKRRQPADDADLGPDRSRQGHRAGHRRDEFARRTCPASRGTWSPADPPEGPRRRRRGLPRSPHRAGPAQRRRRFGVLRFAATAAWRC